MKLCVNEKWLRRRIENDPVGEVEAGRVIRRSEDVIEAMRAASKEAPAVAPVAATPTQGKSEAPLGLLIHMTRRRDRLTVAQFAERVRVSKEEVEAIETDPEYSPRPRTIHNLAEYVKVPPKSLLSLLPNTPIEDRSLDEAVHKFAASSDDLSELSRAERRGLNDFVKFLTVFKGGGKSDGK